MSDKVMPKDTNVVFRNRDGGDACPHCGKWVDSLSGQTRAPEPGDVSICFGCAGLMIFDAGLRLRAPTREEQVDLAGDASLAALQADLRAFNKQPQQS